MALTKGLALIRARKIAGRKVQATENMKALNTAQKVELRAEIGRLIEEKKAASSKAIETLGDAPNVLFQAAASVLQDTDNSMDDLSAAVNREQSRRDAAASCGSLAKQIREKQGLLHAVRCEFWEPVDMAGIPASMQLGAGDTWEEALEKVREDAKPKTKAKS